MNVVMISNYMNHHQISFCDEMETLTNGHFSFIATEAIAQFRVKLGYRDMDHEKDYIIASYENEDQYRKAQEMCQNADVLIIGNADRDFKIPQAGNQIVFYYSERLFKEKGKLLKKAFRFLKYLLKHNQYKNSYLLCASAYAKSDYMLTGNFRGRTYKWGYFPPIKQYNLSELIEKKKNDVAKILWVGRLIDWKHPELAIETALYLRDKGHEYQMEIIGTGSLESYIKEIIQKKDLVDKVKVLGSLPQESVRDHMETANIFLFTSDQNEGWGAVVNEAMNSACAVIGCEEAGCVPYMIDNTTGFIYRSGEKHALFEECEKMVSDQEYTFNKGVAAYHRIQNEWNGRVAAQRLIELIDAIGNNKPISLLTGPCSPA